jgi:RimJ/RimL family protein N-acetyltransferase
MVLHLRRAVAAELDLVLAAESDPEAARFILRWSRAQHEQALDDPDQGHLLVTDDDRPVGFVLLAGILSDSRSVEIRRIVVSPRGTGLGRQALSFVADHAFETLGAHRLWLDVITHNERARRAYSAAGFVEEGVLRDAVYTGESFESLVVMSILASEWAARERAPSPIRSDAI